MSARPRHPNKDIEAAISELESLGWSYRPTGRSSHAWGRMVCSQHDPTGCQVSIWSTPRVPRNHADQLRRLGRKCAHSDTRGDHESV
ncbi:hypothetical protein GA830_10985 [Mesorhizobium sp. NBSH29]|nr:hypothetical protein GA830_10985 [Mesorhizobium sp. NBSH29]